MAFFVALFLGLLLLISGAINVLLMVVSLGSSPSSIGEVAIDDDEAGFRVVRVGGSKTGDKHILRIVVEGAIAESASPMIGAAGGTVSRVKRQLELAARKKSIRGVLLTINSPGGGVTASDEIHRLIGEFRDKTKKPVLAYFGDMSASGGYYIAAACNRIACRNTTITGSIGVIMSSFNFTGLMEKYGVETVTITSDKTPFKDMMSYSRPMKDEERAILVSIVEEMYQRFVDVVDEGRPDLTREEVIELANGSIYSAKQALANGLVDEILDPDEALEKIEELAGLDANSAQLVEQRRQPSFMELMMGMPAADTKASPLEQVAGLLTRTSGAKLLYFWPGGR